jgi:MFS family permease
MSLPHLVHDTVAALASSEPGPFDDVAPQAPPGFQAIQQIVGYVQWIAGASIVGLFFGGIITATAGRMWDHHGSGRLGARMIVGSLALAVLFGLGYTLISQFAGTNA